jgi:hypothetical protein
VSLVVRWRHGDGWRSRRMVQLRAALPAVRRLARLTGRHVKPDRETAAGLLGRRLAALRREQPWGRLPACACAPGVWCVPCLAAGRYAWRP